MTTSKCKHCKHGCSDDGATTYCIFILHTGRRRPCPGGESCTAYERDRQAKREEALTTDECTLPLPPLP